MKKLLIIIGFAIFSISAYSQVLQDSVWKHVYHPDRFLVKKQTLTITGIVTKIISEADGDLHIRVKLDSNANTLLNDGNYKYQDSCLVIEIIYAHQPKQTDAVEKSKGYINTIYIPKKGQHIRVTGTYVFDKEHAWNELHPVFRVEVLK